MGQVLRSLTGDVTDQYKGLPVRKTRVSAGQEGLWS